MEPTIGKYTVASKVSNAGVRRWRVFNPHGHLVFSFWHSSVAFDYIRALPRRAS